MNNDIFSLYQSQIMLVHRISPCRYEKIQLVIKHSKRAHFVQANFQLVEKFDQLKNHST